MIYTLKKGDITLKVNQRGAEMMSLAISGREYLWQGDPKYWKDRAINLFPIVGRLWDAKYTYKGKEYPMGIHGFVKEKDFAVRTGEDSLTFTLTDDEPTQAIYPFSFEYSVTYTIKDGRVTCLYSVKNTGEEELPFGIGGHPGFIFPPSGGEQGEWYLEFEGGCSPKKMMLEGAYITGKEPDYPLKDGKIFFDSETLPQFVETIILKEAGEKVTLKSDRYPQKITVEYPGFKYIAFWKSGIDSPFLCVEPWQSLPSYHGKIDDLDSKRDMIKLQPGQTFAISFSISCRESK